MARMDIDADFKRSTEEIESVPEDVRARIRESIKLRREISELRWRLREVEEPLTEHQCTLAQRHAALEIVILTRR
jgi:regulator of replication initiation timing